VGPAECEKWVCHSSQEHQPMNFDPHDFSEQRLLELSKEAERIAIMLAKLSAECPVVDPAQFSGGSAADVSRETVNSHIRARRLRARFFDDDLFAEPAWDMLLDLFASELSGRALATSSLCIAAGVPSTTALRWMRRLVQVGLIVRRSDPRDGRRVFISLSESARNALKSYFAALPSGDTLLGATEMNHACPTATASHPLFQCQSEH
jgi:hypothetical protein